MSCVSSIINCLIYMCSVPLTVSCKVPANPPLRAHICGIPICPLTTLLAANGAPLLFMSMYMYIVYVYCIVPQGSSNKYSPQCTAHVWCPYLAYLSTLNMGYPWKDLAKCSFIGFRSIGPPCQKVRPNVIFAWFSHCNYIREVGAGPILREGDIFGRNAFSDINFY